MCKQLSRTPRTGYSIRPLIEQPEPGAKQTLIRLALPLDLIQRLMAGGRLCAGDVRCLDNASKEAMRKVCLECCARNLHAECRQVDNLGNLSGSHNQCAAEFASNHSTDRKPRDVPSGRH